MIKPWPLISSNDLNNFGLFKVTKDRSLSPRTNKERDFLIIHMPDWLQMVAITKENELVMVRQYRHASRRSGLEAPGGLLDPTDTDPAQAAARELREETGYGGGVVLSLGSLWPQPALLANQVHFFAARGVELLGDQEQDPGEDAQVVLVKPAEIEKFISEGEIHNAMTITALNLVRQANLI